MRSEGRLPRRARPDISVGGVELNPFSYEFQENPYPIYRWIRDHEPLHRNEQLEFWALSRFRDVLPSLVDWATYSSAEGVVL